MMLHAVGEGSRRAPAASSWRRCLLIVLLVVLTSSTLVQPAAAQAGQRPEVERPTTATTAAPMAHRSSSNVNAALGLVLIGGWLLGGALLLRAGRRRLRAQGRVGAMPVIPVRSPLDSVPADELDAATAVGPARPEA